MLLEICNILSTGNEMTIKKILSKHLQKFSKYCTICLLVKGAISDGRTVNESICRNIW